MRVSYRSLILTFLALTGCWIGVVSMPEALAQANQTAFRGRSRAADSSAAGGTIPALFLSDIHFDPFHDPAKVQYLVSAPVSQWRSILSSSPSSNQQKAFAALQQNCHERGVDTPFTLLDSSLAAMRSTEPDARFIMLSGDLIAHAFSCRYAALVPGMTPGGYQQFVLKTLSFVMEEIRASFPGTPVYAALGNNDTGCDDYRLDPESDFLAKTGKIVAKGLPHSQRKVVMEDFAKGGYYSIAMPGPMQATQLIVVNDLFQSPKYKTCAGKPDNSAAAVEMTWLEQQLARARRSGRRVWVMGHIPPGIDPFSTVVKFTKVCAGESPVMFLSSDLMADLMAEYSDVIRLGIFAHTHMDELRLLGPDGTQPQPGGEHRVAIKIVPSISPVDGNTPSFTIARVNPSSAVLENYDVIEASNQTGIAATWSREYDYAETYNEAQISSSNVNELIEKFHADGGAKTEVSKAYLRNYFVGDHSAALSVFWPEYVCTLGNYTAKAFAACVCSTGK